MTPRLTALSLSSEQIATYSERRHAMEIGAIVGFVLKALALAMGVVSVALGFFKNESRIEIDITPLGVGLTAPAIASLQWARGLFRQKGIASRTGLVQVDRDSSAAVGLGTYPFQMLGSRLSERDGRPAAGRFLLTS